MSILDLWSAACNGNTEALKNYYENGGQKNIRYDAFGNKHSLIMGAFRNGFFDTVDYLLSIGEEITPQEKESVESELRRIETMKKMCK